MTLPFSAQARPAIWEQLTTQRFDLLVIGGGITGFTLLAKSMRGREVAQWQAIKTATTDCIMQHGGALSHHHGVGYDHAAWLAQETSQTAVAALAAIKQTLDPQGL